MKETPSPQADEYDLTKSLEIINRVVETAGSTEEPGKHYASHSVSDPELKRLELDFEQSSHRLKSQRTKLAELSTKIDQLIQQDYFDPTDPKLQAMVEQQETMEKRLIDDIEQFKKRYQNLNQYKIEHYRQELADLGLGG